jgi:hypothetical protein
VQAKIIKLVGLKNGGCLSPINLVTFAGTQNGEYIYFKKTATVRIKYFQGQVKFWICGSYNLSCGSRYTARSKNFKTKGFTWASEVKLFSVHALPSES